MIKPRFKSWDDAEKHEIKTQTVYKKLYTGENIICWWSGGVTSAVAVKKAIELYGLKNCRIIMIDTCNEDTDTYRFKKDCEDWYGKEMEVLSAIPTKYDEIQDVWRRFNSLNVANGAICSSELKREVRKAFQRKNKFKAQVFGFDIDEPKRAKNMTANYRAAKPIYPLLMYGLTKKDCINILGKECIEIPNAYKLGFHNNNCLGTGCVQGGIGYWKKYRATFPKRFAKMAAMEHELSKGKGKPVTCCRDQSKAAKASKKFQVFLVKNPDFPEYKCLDDMKGKEVEPLVECNGFCGTGSDKKLKF